MEVAILCFQFLKKHYKEDVDFFSYLKHEGSGFRNPYVIKMGFLSKGTSYAYQMINLEAFVKKVYGSGLSTHFGINKIIDILQE